MYEKYCIYNPVFPPNIPFLQDHVSLVPMIFDPFNLSLFLKNEMGFYYLFGTDAEYAYLFNGLNICYLNFPFHVLRIIHNLYNPYRTMEISMSSKYTGFPDSFQI
jgi:hypothetical protein